MTHEHGQVRRLQAISLGCVSLPHTDGAVLQREALLADPAHIERMPEPARRYMRRYVDNHPVVPSVMDEILRSPQLLYSRPHMSLGPAGEPRSPQLLTDQQRTFFETFGYLALPGLLAEDIGWVQHEFEAVWAARDDLLHDGSKRTMFPGLFVAQSPRLSTLVEDPRIVGLCTSLLGEGYTLSGGDGNFYSGDTGWCASPCVPCPQFR